MDVYETLRQHARERRDKAIRAAQRCYLESLSDIDKLQTRNGHRIVGREYAEREMRRFLDDTPINELTLVAAAERVMAEEDRPLRTIELLIELKRRGRTCDNPRRMAASIRSAFRYHRSRFAKDRANRWILISSPPQSPEDA